MKAEKLIYLFWTVAITYLFFEQNLGLNMLVISILTPILFVIRKGKRLKNKTFVLTSLLWMISGFSCFLNGGVYENVFYFVLASYFFSQQNKEKISFLFAPFQGIQSFGVGIYNFFDNQLKQLKKPKKQNPFKIILLVLIPLLILIVFFKLYQGANDQFYELTKDINLDFISINLILFFLMIFIFLYGFYYYTDEKSIEDIDEALSPNIEQSKKDKLLYFLGIKTEFKLAIYTILLLSLMLVFFIGFDIYTSFTQTIEIENLSYQVHKGVYSLIFSIVIVILIISLFFRNQLNFIKNKSLISATTLWLTLNLIMVLVTAYKNYIYVSQLGLTEKRLGVFMYLIFCIVGIVFTLYKLYKHKSIWFIVKKFSFTLVLVFTFNGLFNWKTIIVNFNLNTDKFKVERIDYNYLIDLGPEAYPKIIKFNKKHHILTGEQNEKLEAKIYSFLNTYNSFDNIFNWQSFQFGRYKTHQELKNMKL